jgi:hypothetical protein
MKSLIILACFLISNSSFAQSQTKPRSTLYKAARATFSNDTLKMFATKFVMVDNDAITNVSHYLDGT